MAKPFGFELGVWGRSEPPSGVQGRSPGFLLYFEGVCGRFESISKHFLVPGYKPEGPIDSGLSVSQSVSQLVSPSVTAYLGNRSIDFSETWYEVGGPKYKKHSTAAFFFKSPFSLKPLKGCQKKQK